MNPIKYLSTLCVGMLLFAACSDDDNVTAPTTADPSSISLSTPVVTDVKGISATVQSTFTGNKAGVLKQGFCYSTESNPTIYSQVTEGGYDLSISGLSENTTYYIKAYAYLGSTTVYSPEASFTTLPISSSEVLANYVAPTYVDDYRTISGWGSHDQWNLANVHDPTVMLAEDGYYYMYQTDASFGNAHMAAGGHFMCRRSRNLVDWEVLGPVMKTLPSWVPTKLNEIRHEMGLGDSQTNYDNCGYWAPCARKVQDGLYRMYYSITIDGRINGDDTWGERAFIGLMETATPWDINSWEDKGFVITNYSDRGLNYNGTAYNVCYFKYNCIDPSYIITPEGEHWLIYGSWHSGIAAVQLNPEDGKTVVNPLPNPWGAANEAAYGQRIATRVGDTGNYWYRWQGSEGPEIVYRNGYYYLFLAYDGLDVPYNTRVVRSRNITGPYLGMNSTNVTNGGLAYPILTHPYKFSGSSGWVGISHCAVWDDGNDNWYYCSQARFPVNYPVQTNWDPNAVMLGHVRSIRWTDDDWPVVMPERYAAVPNVAIDESELVGEWENISLTYEESTQKTSVRLELGSDHKVTGAIFAGSSWSFDADNNVLTIGAVKLYLQREVDWEVSPRRPTIIYAGFNANGTVTYWGKKR